MIVMLDTQEQFWDYFQQFKKEFSSIQDLIHDLIIVGNTLTRIQNKSQLNKIRPADNFPNANFALPLYHLLGPKKSSKITNVILATGNLFSPINFIDVNTLKQDLLKSNIRIHCSYLTDNPPPPQGFYIEENEEKEFLKDLSCYTEGKFFINTSIKTIIESGAIQ